MSRRAAVDRRLEALAEIRDILGAMKDLALLETHKLNRFLPAQRRVVLGMERAAADFLRFYPEVLGVPGASRNVDVLIGSERGFCGDFNDAVLARFEAAATPEREGKAVAVGYRLSAKLAGDDRILEHLDGASVVEEVPAVVAKVAETLSALRVETVRPLSLTVISHRAEEPGVTLSPLEPFREPGCETPPFAFPPRLYLPPATFFSGLVDHYLYARLHELFYSSLMAENERRLQHMERAMHRLDQESASLTLRRNALYQEDIIEEIEVLLIGTEG